MTSGFVNRDAPKTMTTIITRNTHLSTIGMLDESNKTAIFADLAVKI